MDINNIILSLIATGGLAPWVVKWYASYKEKKFVSIDKEKTASSKHEREIEKERFEFDKEIYNSKKSESDKFQKEIIFKIFEKFVSQGEWITKLHDKSIEKTIDLMSQINEQNKSLMTQIDVLTNRVRTIEDKVVKSSNGLQLQIETLLKLLSKSNKNSKIEE